MGFISDLIKSGSKTEELLQKGAKVIDVRSPEEFQSANVPDSINIPLDQISKNLDRLEELNSPLVLCCASGFRSGRAVGYLKAKGFECSNGGSWSRVKDLLT